MRQVLRAFAGFAIFLGATFLAGAQRLPEELKPPANEQLLLQVHSTGTQIYACKAEGAKFTWTLKGVEAQLAEKDALRQAFDRTDMGSAGRQPRDGQSYSEHAFAR
jgi:hypothetical protein